MTIHVLDNDSDAEGDQPTVTQIGTPTAGDPSYGLPQHGTATINTDGTVTYTPSPGYNGIDSFTYQASDGHGGVSWANVMVDMSNNAPYADNDAIAVSEGTSYTGTVLGNDFDPDGDPLTVSTVTRPDYGSLTLDPDGTFTYTPGSTYHRTDSFVYQVGDGFAVLGAAGGWYGDFSAFVGSDPFASDPSDPLGYRVVRV